MQINYKYIFYFFIICCIVAGIIIIEEEKKGRNVKGNDGKILLGIFVPVLFFIILYEMTEIKRRKNIAYRGETIGYIPSDINHRFYR